MAKWEIKIMQQGELYRTVEVEADNQEDAIDAAWEVPFDWDDCFFKNRDTDILGARKVTDG
jgi:hypothetical protein